MLRRWRTPLLIFLLFVLIGVIEVTSGFVARRAGPALLSLAGHGWTATYQGLKIAWLKQQLFVEFVILSPVGADPQKYSLSARMVRFKKCRLEQETGFCVDADGISVKARTRDAGQTASTELPGSPMFSVEAKGKFSARYSPKGGTFTAILDSVSVTTDVLSWNGTLVATATLLGNDWTVQSAIKASGDVPDIAPASGSLQPNLTLEIHGSGPQWSAKLSGDTILKPTGVLALRDRELWYVKNVDLKGSSQSQFIRLEIGSLTTLGLDFSGTGSYDPSSGSYRAQIIVEGDIASVASSRFGVPLIPKSEPSRWTLTAEGDPEGVTIAWKAMPAEVFLRGFPAVNEITVTLPASRFGEPLRIYDLTVASPDGHFVGQGLYDPTSQTLELDGVANLARWSLPLLNSSPIRAESTLRAKITFSSAGTLGEIAFGNGSLVLSEGLSFAFSGQMRWKGKGVTGQAFLSNPHHSARLGYEGGVFSFNANGADPDGSLTNWIRDLLGRPKPEDSDFFKPLSVSEYQAAGSYEVSSGKLTADVTVTIGHPQADLHTAFKIEAHPDINGWRWKAQSGEFTVLFPLAPDLSGTFFVERSPDSPLSASWHLANEDLKMDGKWRHGILEVSLEGKETAPRLVSLVNRFILPELAWDAKTMLNLTLLEEFRMTLTYAPTGRSADLNGKIRAHNPFLGTSLFLPQFGVHYAGGKWDIGFTGSLEGENFSVSGKDFRLSPDAFSGALTVVAQDFDLAGVRSLLAAFTIDERAFAWLSGTISGRAEVDADSPREGRVLLQVSGWQGGPVVVTDLWLNGDLSKSIMTLSGTGKAGGVPLSLSVAVTEPYSPAREGTLLLSGDRIPLGELPFSSLPDGLKTATFTGYVQAEFGEAQNRVNGSGSLTGVRAPALPSDFDLNLQGDFKKVNVTLKSRDKSVSASATFVLAAPYPIEASFTTTRTGAILPYVPRAEGQLQGHLKADLIPPALKHLEVDLTQLRIDLARTQWILEKPTRIMSADGSRFQFTPFSLVSKVGLLSGAGEVILGNELNFKNAKLQGNLPLAILEAFYPGISANGELIASLNWGETASFLPAQGSLEIRADSVSSPALPEPIEDLAFRVRLMEDNFVVEEGRLIFALGNASFQGAGVFSGSQLDYFAGNLVIENLRLPEILAQDTYASGSLNVTGTSEEILVSGDLQVEGGKIQITTAVVPTSLVTPIPVWLNLGVSLADPLRVVSDNFQAEVTGSLAIRGTLDTPLIFGDLTLSPGGIVKVAGKTFSIQSGLARFTGYSVLPEISARAVREEPPYTIYLDAFGIPPDLKAEFTSSPSLSTSSILSLLTTGRTLEEIQSAGEEMEKALSLGLQGLLSAGLEARFFDRVTTRSATIGGKQHPVMTIGKSIGNRYFAQYTFDTTSGTPEEIAFSYRLHPWQVQIVQGRNKSPAFTITYRGTSLRPAMDPEPKEYTVSAINLAVSGPPELIDELRSALPFKPGEKVTLNKITSVRTTLRKALARRGFLAARVFVTTSLNQENREVALTIVAEPGKVRTVKIEGLSDLPKERLVAQLTELWETAPTDETFLRAADRNIATILEEYGWHLVSSSGTLQKETNRISALFSVHAVPLPRIGSVHIRGDQQVEIPGLVRKLLKKGLLYRPIALRKVLDEWARSERATGYRDFRASVSAPEFPVSSQAHPSPIPLVLTILRGPLYRISRVAVEPGNLRDHRLQGIIETALQEDNTASVSNILALRQRITFHFRQQGFADVYVSARELVNTEGLLELHLSIRPGTLHIVEELLLEGALSETEKRYFARLLAPFKGQQFSPSLEAEIRKILRNSGFPSSYNIRVERGQPVGDVVPVLLHIRLIPVAPLSYTVSAGYGSSSGAVLSFSGLRQGVLTPWQSLGFDGLWSRDFKNADLTFNDPRFQLRDYRVRFRLFAQREVKSDLVVHTRLGGLEITRLSESARSQFSASLQVQRLTYSGETTQSPNTAVVLNLSLLRDRRDSLFQPTRGDLLSLSLKIGQDLPVRKPLFGRATLHFVRATPITPEISLFSRVYAGYGFHLPLGERFFYTTALGVRGFHPDRLNPRDQDGNQVGGKAIALAGVEARWRFSYNLGALAFVDAGNLWERPTSLNTRNISLSAGAGLFYVTPLGPIRLEYQIPIKPEDRAGKNELFLGFSFTY